MDRITRRSLVSGGAALGAGAILVGCSDSGVNGADSSSTPSTTAVGGTSTAADLKPGGRMQITSGIVAPDGFEREGILVNGQMPGPLLRLTKGEEVTISLENELEVSPMSVHWHGQLQRGSYRFDGVTAVTQPPQPPGTKFDVTFTADPGGTYWYHSHFGSQYTDGLRGPLIVDDPAQDDLWEYDADEVVFFHDWFHRSGEVILQELQNPPGGSIPAAFANVPYVSCLVNGKGRYAGGPDVPLTTFDVEKGSTVRLRLINGGGAYPFMFSIDNHTFTVVTADGQPIQEVQGEELLINVGQRYDVLVDATGEGLNWMRFVPFGPPVDGPEGRAVFKYKGTDGNEPPESAYQQPANVIDVTTMRNLESTDLSAQSPREIEMLLGGNPQGSDSAPPYRWSIGDQYWPAAQEYVVDEGEAIRFVLKNPTPMPHPFHLHGHLFSVLGDPSAPVMTSPVLRDTVTVPASGDIAVQVTADNPGSWIWHCHVDWHLATGMARVMRYADIDSLDGNAFPDGTLARLA